MSLSRRADIEHPVIAGIATFALIAWVTAQAGVRQADLLPVVGFLVIMGLTATGGIFAVHRQSWGVALVAFPVAFIFWGLAPFAQYLTSTWLFSVSKADLLLTQAIIIVWLAVFLLGYRLGWRTPYKMETPSLRITPTVVSICWITSLGISAFFLYSYGIENYLVRGYTAEPIATSALIGRLLLLARRAALVLALLPIAQRLFNSGWKPNLTRSLVYLVPAIIVNSPLASARYWAFAMVYTAIVFGLVRYMKQGLLLYLFTLFGTVASSLVEPLRRAETLGEAISNFHAIPITTYLTTVHFDSFQNVSYLITYVEDVGHTLGTQLGGGLIFWFPRSLWAGKPVQTGNLLYHYLESIGYNVTFYNHAVALPGTAWVDFGFLGVIVVGVVYGVVFGFVDNSIVDVLSNQRNLPDNEVNYLLIAGPIVIGLVLIHIRGSFYSTLAIIGYTALAMVLVFGYVRSINILSSLTPSSWFLN